MKSWIKYITIFIVVLATVILVIYFTYNRSATPPDQFKIYNGGGMGNTSELDIMRSNMVALEAAGFKTYTPVRDGFSLLKALANIDDNTKMTKKDELKYYLYAGISSLDFFQLLVECQGAFFDLAPYHSDKCTMNPDNGTVVEAATAAAYNKIRSFFKKCNVKALAKCISTNQKNKNCEAGLKCVGVAEPGYPMGGCIREMGGNNREMGGNNLFSGWDNPMLIALANQHRFQRGSLTYAHANIADTISDLQTALKSTGWVTYHLTHPKSNAKITCTLPDTQLSPVAYPHWITDQIFLGSALTRVGKDVQKFANVVKTLGVKFYGIERFNGQDCSNLSS
jgi:hypothetical protein